MRDVLRKLFWPRSQIESWMFSVWIAFLCGWVACNISHGEWRKVAGDLTVAPLMLALVIWSHRKSDDLAAKDKAE
jgi:hypothetical protein